MPTHAHKEQKQNLLIINSLPPYLMQMRMNIYAVDVGCYDSKESCGPNGSWLSECAKPAIPVDLLNGLIYKWSEEKQFYAFPRLNV